MGFIVDLPLYHFHIVELCKPVKAIGFFSNLLQYLHGEDLILMFNFTLSVLTVGHNEQLSRSETAITPHRGIKWCYQIMSRT